MNKEITFHKHPSGFLNLRLGESINLTEGNILNFKAHSLMYVQGLAEFFIYANTQRDMEYQDAKQTEYPEGF